MSRPRRTTIRKLYREAIIEYHGCGDKELDKHLHRAVAQDVHLAGRAPGQWVDPEGALEIYCENGIPNASDINEFQFEGERHVSYNSDKWCYIDDWVNLALNAQGYTDRVHHEPFNGAVIGVYWL